MTSITQTIPSFIGGISQQPDELMLPGQVKDLLNGIPDITEGLVKRPGSRYINSLSGATSTGSWFSYYRDQAEGAYIGQVQTNGSVNMWSVSDGVAQSVTGSASGYLTHSTTADLKFLTVADTTFVTNTTKTVEHRVNDFSPTRAASVGRSGEEFQTFVELRQVSHGREYSFDVASPSASEEFIGGSSSKGRVTRISVKENPYTTQTNKNNIIYDSNNFRLSIERNTSGNTYEGVDPELPFQGTEILSVSGGTGSGMIIRLTVTGQVNVSKHSGNTLKPDEYVGVYSIVAELLHGGLNYTNGNTVTAVLKGVTYEINIDEIQPIKTKKDFGTYRPAPTSFDANQTISADTILDIVQANSDITPNVQKIGNGFFLSHETAFNVTTAQPDLWRITSTEVNDVSELPRQCKHGMVVEVVNSSESQEDNFYLKFVGENNMDGPGKWEECLGPGKRLGFDTDTLPIIIQRQQDSSGNVVFNVSKPLRQDGTVAWEDRQVGDDTTNDFPTFRGRKITQTFFHRNRLGFLCEDNIILSQADEIYNFFNNTALVVSGNDPIDIQASSTQPTRFIDCIETNTGLLVFGETQQFMLHTDSDALTPDTAKLSNISTYRYSPHTSPISLGTTVGFIDTAGAYSRFFEMFDIKREGEPQIIDQTKVVSKLIPNSVDLISNSRENSTIFLAEKGSPNIYLYRYIVAGSERVQSAWYRWTLPHNIVDLFVLDDELYIISSDYNLLKIALQKFDTARDVESDNFYGNSGPNVEEDQYSIHLDSSVSLTAGSYDGTHTTVSHSFTGAGTKLGAVNLSTGEVFMEDNTQRSGNTYKFFGDFGGDTVVVGILFELNVKLPRIFVKQKAGQITTSDVTASLTIQRVHLRFGPVGQIKVRLKRLGKDHIETTYESTPMDYYDADEAPFVLEKTQTVPVYERNKNCNVVLKSYHPGPASFHSMTWEGDYTPMHHRRV